MFDDISGKRLLVLGGNSFSCEIIQNAQEMGLVVGVTDYYPVENSPGKLIADEAYDVSTIDVDAVVNLIKEKHFDGLITGFTDMLLPYYAEICEKAGIPSYGTKEQFEIFIDKAKYKSLCRKYNVPTVEEYDINAEERNIKFPVLVKPSDSSGSRGISICNSFAELKESIDKAKAFSKEDSVLIEQYLSGREATVFWLFVDGEYYLTAIGNRHVKHCQGENIIPLPVGYTYPASITSKYKTEIENNVKEMFKSVGIKNGMMFMQCKVEDDNCIVYDIGYRLTGSLEYINLENAYGFNPLKMMIHFAITGKMTNEDISRKIFPEKMIPSYNVSCLAKPGTISKIEGLDTIRGIEGVKEIFISHNPGETITEEMRGLLSQITVRVLGTVKNKNQLYRSMHQIESSIHILSTEENEMRIMGIEPDDIEGVVL